MFGSHGAAALIAGFKSVTKVVVDGEFHGTGESIHRNVGNPTAYKGNAVHFGDAAVDRAPIIFGGTVRTDHRAAEKYLLLIFDAVVGVNPSGVIGMEDQSFLVVQNFHGTGVGKCFGERVTAEGGYMPAAVPGGRPIGHAVSPISDESPVKICSHKKIPATNSDDDEQTHENNGARLS